MLEHFRSFNPTQSNPAMDPTDVYPHDAVDCLRCITATAPRPVSACVIHRGETVVGGPVHCTPAGHDE